MIFSSKKWHFWLSLVLVFVSSILLALLITYAIQTDPAPRDIIILAVIFAAPGGIGTYLLVRRTKRLVQTKIVIPEKTDTVAAVADAGNTPEVRKTWMPVAAGIIDITIGGLAISFFISGLLKPDVWTNRNDYQYYIAGLCFSGYAIFGGVHAVLRRRWLLALIGSVCALFPEPLWFIVLGFTMPILAIVLTVISKQEFSQR